MLKIEVNELIAKYRLEPTMRDIFVEGVDDRCCIEHVFYRHKKKHFRVIPIENVNLPSKLLASTGVSNNNRGRVMNLSLIFQDKLINSNSASCIIDRDFDALLKINLESDYLYYTDFSCMEMYAFNTEVLEVMFLNLGISEDVNNLMCNLSEILQELYVIRLTNDQPNWHLSEFSFLKCCTIVNSKIIFNRDEYIKRYLNKNGRIADEEKFISDVKKNTELLTEETRLQCHGHDFVELLLWFLNNKHSKVKDLKFNSVTLWKYCFLCVDLFEISGSELFEKIIRKVS